MATYSQQFAQASGQTDLDNRVAYAIVKYARFLLGGGGDQTQIAWAQAHVATPAALALAAQMRLAIVGDANFGNANADTDAADGFLQSIVETLIQSAFKNL